MKGLYVYGPATTQPRAAPLPHFPRPGLAIHVPSSSLQAEIVASSGRGFGGTQNVLGVRGLSAVLMPGDRKCLDSGVAW